MHTGVKDDAACVTLAAHQDGAQGVLRLPEPACTVLEETDVMADDAATARAAPAPAPAPPKLVAMLHKARASLAKAVVALRSRTSRLSYMDGLLSLPKQCLLTIMVAMFIL